MKKIWLLWALLLVIFVAGCSWWSKKESTEENNTPNTEIAVESCNTWFKLVNCIIDNDTDQTYSKEDRELIRQWVTDMRDSWKGLDEDTVEEMCNEELSKFDSMREYLSQIGCSLD